MEIAYVGESYASLVPAIEKEFKKLSKEAGIIFFSVFWNPGMGGKCKILNVVLGLKKNLSKDAGTAIASQVIKASVPQNLEFHLNTTVYLGEVGAANDPSSKESHPDSN